MLFRSYLKGRSYLKVILFRSYLKVMLFMSYLKGSSYLKVVVFPTLFHLSLNLAIRSLWSEPQSAPGLVFCWLYIASPSLAANNIINLISVLTIWWCPCIVFFRVFGRELTMTSAFSWQHSISLCPASFYTPKPNLPFTPGISWLPTFAFQSLESICYFHCIIVSDLV